MRIMLGTLSPPTPTGPLPPLDPADITIDLNGNTLVAVGDLAGEISVDLGGNTLISVFGAPAPPPPP